MPRFELEYTITGRVVVEADDRDEAEQVMHDSLDKMETSLFDEFDINQIDTESCKELTDE